LHARRKFRRILRTCPTPVKYRTKLLASDLCTSPLWASPQRSEIGSHIWHGADRFAITIDLVGLYCFRMNNEARLRLHRVVRRSVHPEFPMGTLGTNQVGP
jgi:hypothetical protein